MQEHAAAEVDSRRLSVRMVIGYVFVVASGLLVGALIGLIAAGSFGLIEIRC